MPSPAETLTKLDHAAKVMLYVIGVCEGLADKGLMFTPNGRPMTADGRACYEELRTSGFRPTEAEIDTALKVLCKKYG